MQLPSFKYHRPASLAALTALLGELPAHESLRLCAGGTDLVPKLKRHAEAARHLVAVGQVPELRGIHETDDGQLELGAATTLAALVADERILRHAPALAHAARQVATPQIRTRATVAGNLLVDNRCSYYDQSELNRETHGRCYKDAGDVCHMAKNAGKNGEPLCRARFVSDLAPVLLALDARVEVVGPGGEWSVRLRDFYVGDGIARNALAPRELVRAVSFASPPALAIRYAKLRIRQTLDFPSVGVAVGYAASDRRRELVVAVTGIEPRPVYLALSDLTVADAAEAAMAAVSPLNQDALPPAYRRKMVGVLVTRLAKELGAQ